MPRIFKPAELPHFHTGADSTPNSLDPKAREVLREALKRRYSGASNAHSMMVLEQGMTFEKTAVDPEKSAMIETLKFSVDDIARIFRIPAHKLGSLDRATFSNIEEQNQNYIDETLTGWTLRIQQEATRKLLIRSEKSLEVKHDFTELLKGDSNAQADYFGKLFMNGFVCQNEVCRKLNLPQLGPDGDRFYRPANLVPVDAPPAPPALPPPPPIAPENGPQDAPGGLARANAVSTHKKLLASTMKRLLRVEQDKVQRYSRNYGSEHKIGEFYADFSGNRIEEIAEVLESFRANADLSFNARIEARNILNKHVEQSLKESTFINVVNSWLGDRADVFSTQEIDRILETN